MKKDLELQKRNAFTDRELEFEKAVFTKKEIKELEADILREAYLEKVKTIIHKAIWEE